MKCFFGLLCALTIRLHAAVPVATEFVFTEAPFPECHASTIVETTKGSLLAAWFGGTEEKHPDVGIWLSRRSAEGNWSAPREIANGLQADGKRFPLWNPVLFQPVGGPLLLFYKEGPDPKAWWGLLRTSNDDGTTWSAPQRLPEGIVGPIKNKPISLPDGTILCGSSSEDHGWRVHMERTADFGKTWSRTPALNDGKAISAIQPSLLSLGGTKLAALGRSRQGKLWHTTSDDLGLTWSPLTLTDVPNPSSGTDALTLADCRHLLIYNHTPLGRSPLNLAISQDGIAWEMIATLEDEAGKEFSYPAIVQAKDGSVHATWTWQRKRIRYARINLRDLPQPAPK
jgi:predicted neuraminidase